MFLKDTQGLTIHIPACLAYLILFFTVAEKRTTPETKTNAGQAPGGPQKM